MPRKPTLSVPARPFKIAINVLSIMGQHCVEYFLLLLQVLSTKESKWFKDALDITCQLLIL